MTGGHHCLVPARRLGQRALLGDNRAQRAVAEAFDERDVNGHDLRRRGVEEAMPMIAAFLFMASRGLISIVRIHGLWHIIEEALQASGRAGERRVKDVNVSFVGTSAPIVQGTTFSRTHAQR